MKRNLILLSFAIMLCSSLFAQEKYTRLSFSGYQVIIIPSETFSIDIKNPLLGTREAKDKSLTLEITDQRGRVPKDTVIIHTDKIDYLYLHNSKLELNDHFVTDSLKFVAVSSFGNVNVKANYLNIDLSAGSQFQIEGEATFFVGDIGAGSYLDAKSLVSDTAEIDAVGHSVVTINAKKISRLNNLDSSVNNVGKK